jgi:hypothetical protein
MAVGDITRDTGMPIPLRGGFMRLTGTIEASSDSATVGTAKIATNDPTVRTLRYDCIYAGS